MGEAAIRNTVAMGDGMYKSTDAGKTWTNIGLKDTRTIGKIRIDPQDPNTVYAALWQQQQGFYENGAFGGTE